jgi:pimeloyl-ACP methyl ester carboxylesterase
MVLIAVAGGWAASSFFSNPMGPKGMTTSFVLIPGAGGMAWYWHRVVPLLQRAQVEAIAVDLPSDNESMGLRDYAEIVIRAIGERSNVVLVAQSLGGFTAPLVCARKSVRMLIFLNAMIPQSNETAGEWWGNTGAVEARLAAARAGGYSAEFDLTTYFLHDVPEAVLRDGPSDQRPQAESIFMQPCRFERWPSIPIRVIASADDRFFPLEFQRRVARDRLKMDSEALPGGHLVALSNPQGLVDQLLRFAP